MKTNTDTISKKKSGSMIDILKSNELSYGEFLTSSLYYVRLGHILSKIELVNREYGLYNLVFKKDTNVFVVDNYKTRKKDLTIIRNVISNEAYVSLSSLAKFIGVHQHDLKHFVEAMDEPIKFGGIGIKYVVPVNVVRDCVSSCKVWEDTDNLKKDAINLLTTLNLEEFVMSFNKNSLVLRLKSDLVNISKYLDIPEKYHVQSDLMIHINKTLYREYLYLNSLDFIEQQENEKNNLQSQLDSILSFITQVKAPQPELNA